MKLDNLWTAFLATALSIGTAAASTHLIGVASAFGTFIVNSARIEGNANLFDGSQIRTGPASSEIVLQNGATLRLGVNSAGTVYHDHFVLEQGATRVDNMSGYRVQASKFLIESDVPSAQAVVRIHHQTVEIAAIAGSLRVLNDRGALLTRVGAGTASAFNASGSGNGNGQSGASADHMDRSVVGLYIVLGASLAGLGLGIAAVMNHSAPSSPGT